MSDRVTDQQLIEQLNASRNRAFQSPAPSQNPSVVSDPEILTRLNEQRQSRVQATQDMETIGGLPMEAYSVVSEPSVGEKFVGTLETAFSILSSVVAEPAAGFSGLVVGVTDRDLNAAVNAIENTRTALSFQPRTQSGQQQLQAVGDFLGPVGQVLENASASLGDFAYRTFDSPAAAAAFYSLPTIGLELLGLKGARTASRTTPSALRTRQAQRTLLNDPLGRYSGNVADVRLNRAGSVVPDRAGEQLLDLGMRRNDVAVITNSSPETQQIMLRMLDSFETGQTNNVAALTSKMSSEIGTAVTRRLAALQGRRRNLGSQLDNFVSSNMRGQQVSIQTPMGDFLQDLANDFDLKPVLSSNGRVSLRGMDEGVLGTRSMSGVRSIINDTLDLLNHRSSGGLVDAADAHKLKKALDEMLDAQRASEAGLSSRTHARLLELRRGINSALGESFEGYRNINTELSSVIETMSPFDRYRGVGQTWDDAKISDIVGASLRNLGGDSASSASIRADIARMEQNLRDLGIRFNDDPTALITFKDAVENYFSLSLEDIARQEGTLQSATTSRVLDAGASLSVGNTFGFIHDVKRLQQLGMDVKDARKILQDRITSMRIIRETLSGRGRIPSPRLPQNVIDLIGVTGGGAAGSMSTDPNRVRPPLRAE